jgi:Cu/Ag efflux protein CusF
VIRLPRALIVLSALALLVAFATPAMAADTTKGVIKSVNADRKEFVMIDQNGTDWTFRTADNVEVRANDKAVSLDSLKPGDMVYITYAKDGKRLVASEVRVKGSADTTGLNTEGKIKSLDTTNNEFVLTDKTGKDWTFRVNDATKVMASNNRSTKLENMKTGEKVKVHYVKKGNDFWATQIRETQDGDHNK